MILAKCLAKLWMEPHDDISTFLSHTRRAADDAASSPSRSVHTESTHPPPVTIYGPMVDSDGTVDNANTYRDLRRRS